MNYTLEISDELQITEAEIDARFIVPAIDKAFIRTNYP